MIIKSRAPVRIDFAGAWTDVDIFSKGARGVVVNATIDKYVHGQLEVYDTIAASVDKQEGIRVTYWCDLPSGSGLGTSAALNVCWLSLVHAQTNPDIEQRLKLAELAYRLEDLLGILGGKQDQYAAAVGGFCHMTFSDEVAIRQINVASSTIELLQERLILCYTGKSRLSSTIHEDVWNAFRRGDRSTVAALYSLRDCAEHMATALESGRIEEFGELISESWVNQKALARSVTNEQIEELFSVAHQGGAAHGKACGAGGGGCLLFYASPGRKEIVAEALERAGARVIPFEFELNGLQVTRTE